MDAHTEQELREELLQTKLALEAQQKYTQSLISAIPDIITLTNLNGTVISTSATANSTFGYPNDFSFIGKNILEFLHPDAVPLASSRIASLIEGKLFGAEIYLGKRKDGSVFEIEVNAEYIRDENGAPVQMVFITRDISNRLKTEKQLLESEQSYRKLFQNMEQGVVYQNHLGEITDANPAAERILGITLKQMKGRTSKNSEWRTVHPDLSPLSHHEHPAIVALRTGKKITNVEMGIIHPNAKTCIWILVSAEPEFRSGESTPYRAFTTFTDITRQKEAEIQCMGLDVTKRKQAELKLVQSEARYRSFFEENRSIMLVSDLYSDEIVDANPAAADFYGWSREQLCTMNLSQINCLSDDEIAAEKAIASAENRNHFLYRHLLSNGDIREVEVYSSHLLEKEKTYNLSIIHDISNRVKAEEDLRKLSRAVHQSPVSIVITNINGIIEYANPKACETTGYSLEELIGSNPRVLKSGETQDIEYQSLWNQITSGNEWTGIFHNKKKNGELYWESSSISPITNIKGEITHFLAVKLDITKQKEYEAEITSQNARLNAIVQALPDLMFIIDEQGNIIDSLNSHHLEKKYANIYQNDESLQLFHHESSTNQSLEKIKECLETRQLITDELHVTLHGTDYFFEIRMAYLGPNRVLRFVRDISIRKEQENEIRKLNLAIEQSPVSIVITDLKGEISYVSSAFELATGYKSSEVIGQNARILKSGLTDDKIYQELWTTIESGKIWQGEWQNRRKDGSLYWEKISISPIFNNSGEVMSYLAIKEDISSQKLQEEEILRLNSTLEERIIQRTAELKEANQLLVNEIQEREQIEAKLLTKTKELETFFAVTLDMLIIADFNGDFVKVNKTVSQILGFSEEELMQNSFFHHIHPDDIEPTKMAMSEMQFGKAVQGFVNRYKIKSGEYRFIEWNAFPVSELIYAAARDITPKIESENLLNQTRINYETFFNTIDDFLWVLDNQGNILHTNQTVTKRLEYSPEELQNQSVLLVHPEERREEAARIVGEMLAGTASFCPVPVVTQSGKKIPVETRVKAGFWNDQPVIFGVSKDISAIQLSEQKFSSAFKVNSALMAISNFESGIFIDVNQAFLEILGFERNEVIGKTNAECDLLQNPELLSEMISRLEHGNPIKKEEILMKTKSGDQKIGLLSADVIFIGEVKCLLTVTVDITERKQAEEALRKARQEADLANQAKSEFLSRMSHELRTPLNSILGFAQLLELSDIPQQQKKEIRHIMKSGWHLLDLINEVLDISRIEAGKMSLSIEPVQLDLLILEMIDFVKTQAAGKFISVNLQDSIYNSLYILSDRQRLKQVLLNLINNGIKYNKEGGYVRIKIQPGKQTQSRQALLRISVEDSGYGISEESIGKLFQPFERIGAEKSSVEGTGLGLTVVKKIIENMGGEVGVESRYGKGSTFWFELPLAENQIDSIRLLEEDQFDKSKSGNQSGSILYIEDNPYNVELIEQILNMQRPAVSMISNSFGKQAIGLALQNQPDLILLDLDLPDIHGSEVYEQLKANPKTAHIPVVVISSDALAQQINKMLSAGVKHYLTKPIKITEFLDVLDEYIKKS